ncbi:toxin-antitoxin system HicB family antitoxin [Streptomyces sp. TR02-1]|uniref:toxin-antitoxin system HicB family antitoxin n=1 Tax=Streptomyces sp. TR02-1 TaxID=3385977 RepID=UPI00399F708B
METKPITLRVPADDADRITREAAEHGLSVNAYVHQTVMADVNKDIARFIAPLRGYAAALNADPSASAAFDELDSRIDPKPRTAGRAAA